MSALQFSIILITCYTLTYEVTAISAKELKGDISTMWEIRFATLQSSVLSFQSRLQTNILNVVNDMSYERKRRTLLEDRVADEKQKRALLEDRVADEKQKRALLEDRVADEKQKRALLEEQLDALQKTLHNLTNGQSLFQEQLSDEKQKRTLLQDQSSDEKQKRTLSDERLDALQKTLHNLTHGQSLFQDQLSDEKQKRTLLQDQLSDEKQKRTLSDERLDALQKTLHNLTHGQSLFQDQLSDEKQKRTLLQDQLSDEKQKRTLSDERLDALQKTLHNLTHGQSLFQDQLSDEKQKRTLSDERLDALQKTLHNSTFRQSLFQDQLLDGTKRHMLLEDRVGILQEIVHDATRGMSYEKQRRTQIEDELSHEKRNQTLLEERLDALQATVYNSTRDLSCKERLRFLENQVEMVKEDLTTKTTNFADCWELRTRGGFRVSGVYDIYPALNQYKLRVRCDMETDGGGWTVLQRRYDGSVNFNQSLEKYENGFGDVSGEHWAGLHWMHVMTSRGAVQMRVDLCGFSGQAGYAVYGGFNVSDGGDGYRLHAGRYITGSIKDWLRYHDGHVFLTTGRCATRFRGGWWYRGCITANLNGGPYNGGSAQGIVWYNFGGSGYPSLRSSEIKIRPLTAPGDTSRPYTCPP